MSGKKKLSGWTRLWIVCAILMWGYGAVWFFGNAPYVGGPPERGEMVCYGDRPLTDEEIFSGTENSESGAELIQRLDLEEAAKQRERVEGSSALSEFLATMRECTPEEEQQQLADYYWNVAGVALAALLVLLSPFFLAGAFFVVRWIWRGFKPSAS